jgi:hypothetical protein
MNIRLAVAWSSILLALFGLGDLPPACRTNVKRVFTVCEATPQHTYQVLTKRADRLPRFFAARRCPPNVDLDAGPNIVDVEIGIGASADHPDRSVTTT